MLHCTIDLSEDCNYSKCLQLQAGASCCRTTSCLNTMCKSRGVFCQKLISFLCIKLSLHLEALDQVCFLSFLWTGLTSRLHWGRTDHQQCQCVHHLGRRKHVETGEATVFGLLWCLAGKLILHVSHLRKKYLSSNSSHGNSWLTFNSWYEPHCQLLQSPTDWEHYFLFQLITSDQTVKQNESSHALAPCFSLTPLYIKFRDSLVVWNIQAFNLVIPSLQTRG